MDLSQRVSNLSLQQRDRFLQKLRQQNIDTFQLPIAPVKRKKDKGFPLSFAQERLWVIQQMEPENTAYNIIKITQLQGNLNKIILEKSINEIIKRHEILRTIFLTDNETPLQVILPQLVIPLEIIDLKELTVEEQNKAIKQIIQRESLYSFDLTRGPLLHTTLLRLQPREHLFLLTIHHIITDGTSVQIFENELAQFYHALAREKSSSSILPGIPIQYVDYACWQRQWLYSGSPLLEKQKEYWLNEFNGEIPVLSLPMDYPRPLAHSFEGNSVPLRLGVEETEALKQLALHRQTTLFALLLAILNVFLTKLSGQEVIVIGATVANRRHPQINHLMGMFVNTLALRNFPQNDKSFNPFLKEVRERTLKALENQDYQYEELVGNVLINRDTGRNPLFDFMFNFENIKINEIKTAGLKLKEYQYARETSKFDITLTTTAENNRLNFTWEYCTRLFKEKTIRRFIQYFKTVISSVISNPGIKIAELEIITAEEKNQMLFAFNDTDREYPGDKLIHELFEKQVEKTPDRLALIGSIIPKHQIQNSKQEGTRGAATLPDTTLITYRELNRKANQFTRVLKEKGAQPDIILGIMVERSVERFIGIFGILKAGGAYLPIDPAYPEERVQYILKDSNAQILVTNPGLSEKFEILSIVNCQLSISNG